VRRFAFLLAVALLLAGCGGDETGAPGTSTATGTAPAETETGTETVPTDISSFGVYFLRDEKVAPAYRAVPQTEAVGTAALEALLAGPTTEEGKLGLSSTIPAGTKLLGLDVQDGVATVDLSPEFEPLRDPESIAASLAQIAYTLTQFSTVERVWVAVQGEPVGSQSEPLTRDAVADLTPLILVEHPAIGETVTSPITVSGTASVFEATLRVRLEGPDGESLWEDTVTASEGAPSRGPFAVEIPFVATGPGKIVAFSPSAKDGSAQHTFEVPIVLSP
jgi:sporulation and spore germination protein/immunoglobulin-like protein involved in spore germination